eukprot:28876-Eustigmatos_ZCMA.PRE.1
MVAHLGRTLEAIQDVSVESGLNISMVELQSVKGRERLRNLLVQKVEVMDMHDRLKGLSEAVYGAQKALAEVGFQITSVELTTEEGRERLREFLAPLAPPVIGK